MDLVTCFPECLITRQSSSKLSRTSLLTPIALQCLVMHFWLVVFGPSFRRTSLMSLLNNSIRRSNGISCPGLSDTVLFHIRRWPSLKDNVAFTWNSSPSASRAYLVLPLSFYRYGSANFQHCTMRLPSPSLKASKKFMMIMANRRKEHW